MTGINIEQLRNLEPHVLCLGTHRGIIQSMLDFDYLADRPEPTILGIVATGHKTERYFFGRQEVVLPVYAGLASVPESVRREVNLFVNFFSGRRVLKSSLEAIDKLPSLVGATIFAEGLPERHAIQLYRRSQDSGVWVLGGASVGIVIPNVLKLGAIGGTQAPQLGQSRLFTPGSVAVISSSGGMVNEIIRTVASSGHSLSFSLALGGERFPMVTPQVAFKAAQDDPNTETIAYFGELGGQDEYLLVEMLKSSQVTKPVVSYIAGSVAELFKTPPQFGHAKAMATRNEETARSKATAMRDAGASVGESYSDFAAMIRDIPKTTSEDPIVAGPEFENRSPALFASSVSGDVGDEVVVLRNDLLSLAENNSFAHITVSMFIGRQIQSTELESFVDFVLRLLVDHGPYQSGPINTMVAARAGKDLVSSLVAGLLTIGPRFGGAINESAATWLRGVTNNVTPAALVEEMARARQIIPGIGHKKYRVDQPDPRVKRLLKFADQLSAKRFTNFALGVESETVRKKGNLILNVDGTIAAIMLDLLSEKEGLTDAQLTSLTETEFFNALFVLSRSVGLMAHYFDQVRLDEGLFRLSPNQVAKLENRSDISKPRIN